MAKKPRVLQWRENEIEDVPFEELPGRQAYDRAPRLPKQKPRAKINIAQGMALFGVSFAVLMYAGAALELVLFIFYSAIFG